MKADSVWIGQTLDRYERRLLAYAFRITGDTESARDVVQETFLELCRANRARIDGHLAPWLYTVCRNRALNVRKKDGRMAVLSERRANGLQSLAAAPNEVAQANEQHRIVHQLLLTLPEREQEVFRLKFGDGLTYREISKVTGIPLSTISHIIHTAIKTLRDQLNAPADTPQHTQGVER
jgi:RNA polymerase sigma-70 factor (ECF subfamily)